MFGSVFKELAADLNGTANIMRMIPMAAAGIGVGLAAISGISVKMASDFDQQLARIAGLTDTSAQMMDFYKKKLLEMSPQLDMSASDAAKSLYFIVSAGFSGQRALDVLSYSAKSATASLADQAAVSDAMTSITPIVPSRREPCRRTPRIAGTSRQTWTPQRTAQAAA